jgi:SAM-dependent methyltransferase
MGDDDKRVDVSDFIRQAWDKGQPSGWFEPVYQAATSGEGRVPWARMQAHSLLADWLEHAGIRGDGRRALVIGCGLGDDAEALNRHGFDVVAFDISPTAIDWAQERFAGSGVEYLVADLFDLPAEWRGAFDFVLEINTLQALPYDKMPEAARNIADCVNPGGDLLVICFGREPDDPHQGIPWPLSRKELATLTEAGLTETAFDVYPSGEMYQFRVRYHRDPSV